MTQGIQIRNANGALVYSTDSTAWNQVGFYYVAAGGLLSVYVPAIIGKEVIFQRVFAALPPPNTGATAPSVTVNSVTGVVSATGGEIAAYVLVFMR